MNPVIIFGATGIGRLALEIFNSNETAVYGFLDEDTALHNTQIDDVTVLGSGENEGFLKLIGKKCDAFIACDDTALRGHIAMMLLENRKVMPVNAIHKLAYIAPNVELGHGNLLGPMALVGSGASMGHYCIIHSGAVIDFQTNLANNIQVGAGALIGNGCIIGDNVFIGIGAILVPGLKIGKNARIGAGSVVIADVEANATVFGNPAQKVKS